MQRFANKKRKTLTNQEVQQIRKLYATDPWSYKQLAEKFDVSEYQIEQAVKGVTKWKPTDQERFDAKWTENEAGCRIWNGYRDKDGYGQFRKNGKTEQAHRISYRMHKREIPKGQVVRHICHNSSCVHPDHLIVGTHQDNMDDLKESGNAKKSRLSSRQSLVVHYLVNKCELSKRSASEIYGVKGTTARNIARKDMYEHLAPCLEEQALLHLEEAKRTGKSFKNHETALIILKAARKNPGMLIRLKSILSVD